MSVFHRQLYGYHCHAMHLQRAERRNIPALGRQDSLGHKARENRETVEGREQRIEPIGLALGLDFLLAAHCELEQEEGKWSNQGATMAIDYFPAKKKFSWQIN